MKPILDFFVDEPSTDDQKFVDDALKRYFAQKASLDFGEAVVSRLGDAVLPDNLATENQRLDIAMKRRALGFNDSDDLDSGNRSNAILASLGINFAKKLRPDAQGMRGTGSIFKELENVGTRLRGSINPIKRALGIIR